MDVGAGGTCQLYVVCNREMLPGSQKDQWDERSIYLHLFDFYGKSVGNYTSQMDCMGNEIMKLVNLPTFS